MDLPDTAPPLERDLWDAVRHHAENMRLIEQLLRGGANPNKRNDKGETVLVVAAQVRSLPLIELLLAHKAKVNLRDKDGESALDRVYSLLPLQVFFSSGMSAKARELAPPLLRAGATINRKLAGKLQHVLIQDFDPRFANVLRDCGKEPLLRAIARDWQGTEELSNYLRALDARAAASRQLERHMPSAG